MTDFEAHLVRQMVFSRATFGPGARMNGVLDYISKEIKEVRASDDPAAEWVDVVILALDGLTRQLWQDRGPKCDPTIIAEDAVDIILKKQAMNEVRDWPDWRTTDQNKAIEHVRTETDND